MSSLFFMYLKVQLSLMTSVGMMLFPLSMDQIEFPDPELIQPQLEVLPAEELVPEVDEAGELQAVPAEKAE